MTSLRRTLTLRLLATLAVLMAVATALLFLGIRSALTREFDETLMARLVTLQSATRWDGEKVDLDYTGDAMPWYQPGPESEYFEVLMTGSGGAATKVVARSASLGDSSLGIRPADGRPFDAPLADGRRGRVAQRSFKPPPEEELDLPGKEQLRERAVATAPTLSVAVAMSRERLDRTMRTIAIAFAVAGGAMALGLIAGVRLALARGLAPLDAMSSEVQSIGADTLSSRLSGDGLPDELRPMQSRLNELLGRLEAAFLREKRFTAGAAHELRTPVAELRSLLEVSLSRPRSAEAARATIEEALDITLRAQGLVRALLVMARPPGMSESAQLVSLDPSPILHRVVERHEPEARARGGCIECTIEGQLRVRCDQAALESILANVMANAVEYSYPRPHVVCRAHAGADNTVVISVCNPVKEGGVTQADLDRFFEPFWRSSESRTDRSHLGMGLAVARGLAESMAATLSVHVEGAHTVRAQLVLEASGDRTPTVTQTEKMAEPPV